MRTKIISISCASRHPWKRDMLPAGEAGLRGEETPPGSCYRNEQDVTLSLGNRKLLLCLVTGSCPAQAGLRSTHTPRLEPSPSAQFRAQRQAAARLRESHHWVQCVVVFPPHVTRDQPTSP